MRLSIFIFLLLIVTSGLTQVNLPPIYPITNDTAGNYFVEDSYTQILEDPSSSFTIEQINQPALVNRFHSNETKTKGINYSVHTYWIRFRINNTLNHDVTFYVSNIPAYTFYRVGNLEFFNTYVSSGTGGWIVNNTGELVPWQQRNGLKHLQSIPLRFKSNEETLVYLRLHSSFRQYKPLGLFVVLQPEAQLYKTSYTAYHEEKGLANDFINTLLVGLLLLIASYNLYNYALTRDKSYLYFALFLASLCLGRLQNFWFLLTPEQPAVFYWGNRIFFWLTNVFFVQYIRQFLQTRTVIPRTDRWLVISLVIHILFILVPWAINPWLTLSQSILIGFGAALALELPSDIIAIAIIQLYLRNYAPVKLILPAITPVLVLWTVGDFYANIYTLFAIVNNKTVSFSLLFLYGEFLTIGWWAVGASGALTRRFNEARNQLLTQALEKEQIEKEREMERGRLIEAQKLELETLVFERTAELQQSLEDLKSAQAQLIQSEKMASLGELTAGIAHEIQNPLNFVNNFSEVNTELIAEMKGEINKGNMEDVKSIASDIEENELKILHHGKRADAIVKGMLEHSRTSTGKKEPTNINALADEYLRLSYHGLRAKDKSFHANFKTYFDESIGKIEVVPQDIGRVLLNLYNNAFYSVNEKKKQLDESFEPEVSVSTKRSGGKVDIIVRDNGNGIPKQVLEKVYQPFFTTKPTGQGTGLGLSMSYDIIKAHGGELKVETKEGEFAAFIIQLPHQNISS